MAAIKKNLYIELGTDVVLIRFRMKDSTGQFIDLTGCKARSQIRTDYKATTALITFSTDDNSIVFDNVEHTIAVIATPEMTNPIKVGKGVWDFEFVDSLDKVSRIFEGNVVFSPQVTKIENL